MEATWKAKQATRRRTSPLFRFSLSEREREREPWPYHSRVALRPLAEAPAASASPFSPSPPAYPSSLSSPPSSSASTRRRKASRLGRRPSRATTWTPRQRQEATTPPRRLPLPSPLLSSPAHSGPDHAEAAAALPVLLPVDPPRPAAVAAVPHLACDGGPGGQTRRDASRDLRGEAPFRGPLLRLRAEQGHVHHLGPAAAPAAWSPTSTSCLIAWTGPPLIDPSTAPATVVPMAVICRHRRRSSATAPPEIILTSPSRTGPSGAGLK
ncbi:hypothetical protein OPV22_025070 [Ensete ventricosum]|uniref:Uncharacterized protein n=1 Tax=Ensete ventricosum TaxID=4639 RepID=A0AAV8QEM1_ENSVE|nr:hypothetical protein OPV22_025070 [Ensete ventricosum]